MSISLTTHRSFFEPWKEKAFGAITADYTSVGTLLHTSRIFAIHNLTDVNCAISYDGTESHWPVAAGGAFILDEVINGNCVSKGTTVYVKYIGAVAPSSGSVIVSSQYHL